MKKILTCIMCGMSITAGASDCLYHTNQQLIRNAENLQDIAGIENIDVNQSYPCGGNLLQVAVVRGNPDVFAALLEQGANYDTNVSLTGYEIKGAPENIPFVLFAARYAPTPAILDSLLRVAADMKVKDSNGHDIFWYFEQNPVLRDTYLTKEGHKGLISPALRILNARRALKD